HRDAPTSAGPSARWPRSSGAGKPGGTSGSPNGHGPPPDRAGCSPPPPDGHGDRAQPGATQPPDPGNGGRPAAPSPPARRPGAAGAPADRYRWAAAHPGNPVRPHRAPLPPPPAPSLVAN